MRPFSAAVCLAILLTGSAAAAGQRDRIRQAPRGDRSTAVTDSQASELTLTLTDAAVRPIQVWVRTAGAVDDARRSVTATVRGAERKRVKVGQRVRAFSPESRSRMYQATVTRVVQDVDAAAITVVLTAPTLETSRHFILEIVTEEGEFLTVPNEAILETGGKRVVYVQQQDGSYVPREVVLGVQGELYTQVMDGLQAGDRVVTIGSFFIDAEHKLKGS